VERIKQAIEKVARKSRTGGGEAALSPRPSQSKEGSEEINYTHTRVVDIQYEHLERNRIVAINKSDPKSMVFDLLRTQVLQKMEENNWRTLAITSATPESGKSMISINLAISISQQIDKTALLVDFDLRRPKIATYLGISMEKSLNDLLEGTAELSEVLVNPDMPGLVVLAPNNPVKKSSETLASKKISDLIKDLKGRYKSRIVIFDLPPLLVIDDAMAILPQIDCVLLVVPNGMNTKQEIEESMRYLASTNLIGTVLNKADIEPISKYYYSSYE
jgi:protein-tyrosine kinase